MRTLILICLVIGSGFAASLRAKRDLFQFGQMILHATSRWPLNYNGYGCWCGQGGYGPTVDETDRCCRSHDKCYGWLEESGTCNTSQLYSESYNSWVRNPLISSSEIVCGSGTSCQVGLCECDRTAAHCFRDSTFNPANMNYPKFTCWALSFFTQFWE